MKTTLDMGKGPVACTLHTGNLLSFPKKIIFSKSKFTLIGFLIFLFGANPIFAQVSQTFIADGTFVVPPGVTTVQVEAWGGGGAGGGVNGANFVTRTGGGGAGGAYVKNTSVGVTPGASISVTVGAGGVGANAAVGGQGGSSIFPGATTVTALGGLGGGFGSSSPANGAGAALTTGTFNGGSGFAGVSGRAGSGGGGAGNLGSGGAATAAAGGTGGAGGGGAGATGITGTGNGTAATALSGGGSGGRSTGNNDRVGGNGFRGQVIVTYTCPVYALTDLPTTPSPICGSTPSVITLTSSSLFSGVYTVSYNIGGPTLTAPMTFTAGTPGTGTFTTSTLPAGTVTVTVTKLTLGSCISDISSNNVVSIEVSAGATVSAGPDQIICVTSPNVTMAGTMGGAATEITWSGGDGSFEPDKSTLNATYIPSETELLGGPVVLTITTNDPDGLCTEATDDVTITFSLPPTADAGGDQGICSDAVTVNVTGIRGGAGITSSTWTTSGTGTFANAANLSTTYTPSAADKLAGSVTLTFTTNDPPGTCVAASDTMLVTISPVATANAGVDQTVCSSSPAVTLAGVVGGSATAGTWTGGNGTFSPSNTALNAVYTPSAAEIAAGPGTKVTLTLTTDDPSGACNAKTDQMQITINQAAVANAGLDQTICSGSTVSLSGTRTGTGVNSSTWSTSGSGSFSSTSNLNPTYTPSAADRSAGTVTITLTTNDPAGICGAGSDSMIVTINPAATATAGANQSVCAGGTITLAGAKGGAATSTTWSAPSGSFGDATSLTSTYTPSIASGTVVLTLTTDDPAGPCPAASSTLTVTVNPQPALVIISPASTTVCEGTINALTAAGGSVPGFVLKNENFDGTVSFVSSATTNPWAKQADGFNPGVTFHSPTNTSFDISYIGVLTNGTANSQLTTPVINTTGYTALVLAFDHTFFLSGATGTGKVEISTDGGTTWPTTLVTYSSNQGDQDSWLPVTLNMNAFINQTNLKIRFNFVSSAGGFLNYSWWAIDSFSLTGTKPSVTWAPQAGLYTDAGANTAYTGGVTGTVYAKSLSTQTYTATSTSGFGCTRSDAVTLTVNPVPTLSGVAQAATICQDTAATINLSGLLPSTTSTVSYKIGSGAVVPVANVVSDASGNASFTVSLVLADNGQVLMITNIQRTDNSPSCSLVMATATAANSVTLQVNANVTYYADVDGDLFGSQTVSQVSCFGAPSGYVLDHTDCNDNQLQYLDNDGDLFGSNTLVACGVLNHTDCNDNQLQYIDADGDGFGADVLVACGVTNNTDCDDEDNTKHTTFSFYTDSDIDGYGAGILTSVCAVNASTPPSGFSLNNTDCDDTKSTVHPGAVEIGYNLTDDDCDGLTDEGFPPKVTTIIGCNYTLTAIDSYIYANLVGGAQGYRWRVTTMSGPSINTVQFIDTALRAVKLTQLTSYAFNTVYKVEVAVYYAGFLQPFTASNCTVSTPATTTSLINCEAGTPLTAMTDVIYADLVPFATGYRFKIFDPVNPLTNQVLDRQLREFRMNLITAFQVKYGKSYNVQVAIRNTDGSYLPYGPTCSVTTPLFPSTSIQDSQCDNGFGAPYAVPNNNTMIYANSYPGAIAYVFRLVGSGVPGGVEITRVLRAFSLNEFAGMGLIAGADYNVTVRMIFNYADPAGPYGKVCRLTTPAISREDITQKFSVLAHPNPFSESFGIEVVTTAPENLTVKVYDMTGRLLEVQTVAVTKISTLKVGERYPSGVYNVIVSQGDNVNSLRLIKR